MPKTTSKSAQNISVRINTDHYVASHGKSPRGSGMWGFCPEEDFRKDSYIASVVWFTGTYSNGVKSALAYFKTGRIVVCP